MIPIYVVQQQQIGRYQQLQDCLDNAWWDFLLSCGLIPILIPNDPKIATKVLEQRLAKAALLTGGGNFCSNGSDSRSATEITLLRWSLETNSPVIGVCRGMQAMLLFCGGTLQGVSGHVTPSQKLLIEKQERQVNSFHNFGCYETPSNFEIMAVAPDNVVKAVRAVDRHWLGIMWHPERLQPFQTEDQIMFYQFITGNNRCKPSF